MFQRFKPTRYHFHRGFLLATSIGVVIHELAHKEMVTHFDIDVKDVCLFQLDDPAGYVTHDAPRRYTAAVVISVAPFVINTAVAYTLFTVIGGYLLHTSLSSLSPTALLGVGAGVWTGVSAGIHAFPSIADTQNIWAETKHRWTRNPLVLLSLPLVVLLLLLNKLKPVGAHILFTAGIAIAAYYSVGILFGP